MSSSIMLVYERLAYGRKGGAREQASDQFVVGGVATRPDSGNVEGYQDWAMCPLCDTRETSDCCRSGRRGS